MHVQQVVDAEGTLDHPERAFHAAPGEKQALPHEMRRNYL
jgi:hypothetical protein